MSVSDWSTNADENTTVDGINIAEHCPAKNINNAIRSVMASVKKNDASVVHTAYISQWDEVKCVRYSSGLQICWGRVKVNGAISATNTKVTFPVAFKLTPAVLTTGNANYLGYNVMVGWETATSFTIGTTSESPAVGETSWFAVGPWK